MKIKKLGILLFLAIFVSVITPNIIPNQITTVEAAKKVKINKTKDTLIKGDKIILSVKNANSKVKWTTSDKKIATVSSSGKVTAKNKGKATITATVNKEKFACEITVETPNISTKNATIYTGDSLGLVINDNTQSVKWVSSNKKIATVDSKGVVNAKKDGKVIITAKIDNKTYKCNITIKTKTKVTGISLSQSSNNIYVGDTFSLNTTINPNNATNKNVNWSSSNSSVATVNNGIVTGLSEGTTTIIATSEDNSGIKASCTVAVSQKYGSISGNITWQYNKYIGTKSDTGAYVALIPKNINKLKGVNHKDFSMLIETNGEDGIYTTKVNGYGQYELKNIPVGQYWIFVVSKYTTSGSRFNNPDIWNSYINSMFGGFLSTSELSNIKLFIGYHSTTSKEITIQKDQTTPYSYDFGYTYL